MSATKKKYQPFETKLTAVSMSFRGRKISVFLDLPIVDGKPILPEETKAKMEESLGATRGDTISLA
jgi:hypothetical protein